MNWLERYRLGECSAVWGEMRDAGSRVFDSEEVAFSVAYETMTRARQNLETIKARLVESRYIFFDHSFGRLLEPDEILPAPSKEVDETIRLLEAKTGRLPLSLKAWFKVVGGVNFMGHFPENMITNRELYLEPIVLVNAGDLLQEVSFYEAQGMDMTVFRPTLAPDKFIKAGYGGGSCAGDLGAGEADFALEMDDGNWWFRNYLKHVFEWGGFPGLSTIQSESASKTAEFLKTGLLEV